MLLNCNKWYVSVCLSFAQKCFCVRLLSEDAAGYVEANAEDAAADAASNFRPNYDDEERRSD